MGLKQCDKCGESVDEAKAFCPSCGNAFVEEQKRAEPTKFDQLEGTQQFGKTMYNQMLSDMGLSIPPKPVKAEQIIQPIQPAAPPAQTSKPKPPAPPTVTPRQEMPAKSGTAWKKFVIIGIIAIFLLFLLLAVLGIAGYFFYLRSGQL